VVYSGKFFLLVLMIPRPNIYIVLSIMVKHMEGIYFGQHDASCS